MTFATAVSAWDRYVGVRARTEARSASADSAEVVAERIADQLDPADLREVAIRALVVEVESVRRRWAYDIERAAVRPASSPAPTTQRGRREANRQDRERWLAKHPEEAARFQAETDAITERFAASMREHVEAFATQVRLELTAELLASEFAVGDGRRVTWGEASMADHQSRANMLSRNAASISETAAAHLAAVRMIEERGAATLAECR